MTTPVYLKTVHQNADEEYKEVGYRCMKFLSTEFSSWDTDDFHQYMERWYPNVSTHTHNVVGAMIRNAIRNEWMEQVDYKKSTRPGRHASVITVYRSLLYKGMKGTA